MAPGKRKQLVIEPAIQYSLIRQLLAQWGLHLLSTLVLMTILQVLLGGFFHPWSYHLERIWPTLASLTLALFCLLPVFVMQSLKLSNRFAGPIHRFRRELRRLGDGAPYREVKFRENDFWQEISGEFESAVQAVRRQIRKELEAGTVPDDDATWVVSKSADGRPPQTPVSPTDREL